LHLDNPVGHRDHVVDGAERVLQGISAPGGKLALEQSGDLLGGDLGSVRPVFRCDPEDIAQTIVADVPPFGEAADDIAGPVKPDEPLRDIPEQHGIGWRKRPQRGVSKLRFATDNDRFKRTFGLLPASGGAKDERGEEQDNGIATHAAAFTRNVAFSKHLDMSSALYY
jgi:hypothetical protein